MCKFSSILPRNKRSNRTETSISFHKSCSSYQDQTLCWACARSGTSTCYSTDMTCMHQPPKQLHWRAPLSPAYARPKEQHREGCTSYYWGTRIWYGRAPGQRNGDTQSLTTCIFPAQWQCLEHSLQLSITPRKRLHKGAAIWNVHLKASRGGAPRAVKELFRAAKQTPLMQANTIINKLTYSIWLWI